MADAFWGPDFDSLQAEDPGAPVLPYCLSGGTDNKALSTIGIRGFGFAPLQLPAELDFPAMSCIWSRAPVKRSEPP